MHHREGKLFGKQVVGGWPPLWTWCNCHRWTSYGKLVYNRSAAHKSEHSLFALNLLLLVLSWLFIPHLFCNASPLPWELSFLQSKVCGSIENTNVIIVIFSILHPILIACTRFLLFNLMRIFASLLLAISAPWPVCILELDLFYETDGALQIWYYLGSQSSVYVFCMTLFLN